MFAVYNVKPADRARIDAALDPKTPLGNVVTRQSVSVRDAAALGLKDLGTLVLIEGEEGAVKASGELFAFAEKLPAERAEEARRAFKAQEDDVASGVGLIFGP